MCPTVLIPIPQHCTISKTQTTNEYTTTNSATSGRAPSCRQSLSIGEREQSHLKSMTHMHHSLLHSLIGSVFARSSSYHALPRGQHALLLLWFSSGTLRVFFLTEVLIISVRFSREMMHCPISPFGWLVCRLWEALVCFASRSSFPHLQLLSEQGLGGLGGLTDSFPGLPFLITKKSTAVTTYFRHGMTLLKSPGSDILLPAHCRSCETPPYVLYQLSSRCQRMPQCQGEQCLG